MNTAFMGLNTHYMTELLAAVDMTTVTTMTVDTAKAMTAMATVMY